MLTHAFIALSVSAVCPNGSLLEAAETVLQSIRTQHFECVQQNIQNSELKFPDGHIDAAVLQSLGFHARGKRSYYEIARSADVFIDIKNNGGYSSVFFVDGKYKNEYYKDSHKFKDAYFMKGYFVCNFVKRGTWKLTEDFCFTEGEY